MYNINSQKSSHLAVLDIDKSSHKTYIPCCIESLGLSFVVSFDSSEKHCTLIVISMRRKRILARMNIDFQISRFISSHNKLTVMYLDESTVVFGVSALLFFVNLKKMVCEILTNKDDLFSGVFKTDNLELVNEVKRNLSDSRNLIRYKEDSDFYIIAEPADQLYTYKNQFRMLKNGEIRYLSSENTVINPDLYKLTINKCSTTLKAGSSTVPIFSCLSLNVIPFNMESIKIGHQMKLLSWKHEILTKRTETIEMVYFDMKTHKREVKRTVFNKGTMKFQKSMFTEPDKKFLILFYIKSGYKLVYRIYNFETNEISGNYGLILDTGPNEFLKCEDNLDFIINFRFSGIVMGNFKQFTKPEIIPNTAHMFRCNLTSYGAEEDCYYKLVDDFRTTRLEQIAFVEEQKPEINFKAPMLKKVQSEVISNKLKNTLKQDSNLPEIRVDSPRDELSSGSSRGEMSVTSLEENIQENSAHGSNNHLDVNKDLLNVTQSPISSMASSSRVSMTNSKAENRNLENLVPETQILFHNDRDFNDMKHFSNNMLLSFRENMLYLFDTKNSEKQSVRIPFLTEIKEVHFFTFSDRISYVDLIDSKFCNLYSLKIMNGVILDLNITKACFYYPKLLILSRNTKMYQVSEDHYFDILKQAYIKPDFENEINEMISTQVKSAEELEKRLQKIVALGFKFSRFFGKESALLDVFREFGDSVLTDGYRFKYGIDSQ